MNTDTYVPLPRIIKRGTKKVEQAPVKKTEDKAKDESTEKPITNPEGDKKEESTTP